MFLFDESILTPWYTLPFLVGLAMPGWRSIIAMGLVGLGIAVFAGMTAGGGVGAAFGMALILIAVGGLWCGLLTRALTLWIAPLRRHPLRFIAIAALGYILPPVVLSGPAETIAWLRRPSRQACMAATYRATIADMMLHIRGAPVFSFHVLKPGSPTTQSLSFYFERDLEELCGRGLRDSEVLGPVAVQVDPSNLGSSLVENWITANCTSPRDETLRLVCSLTDRERPPRRMVRALIYGPELDVAIQRRSAYAVEKKLHQQVTEGKEPFVLLCERDEASTVGTPLFCAGYERAPNGLLVKYVFRTNGAQRMADSDAIRSYLRELITSFSPSPSSSPGSPKAVE